MKKVLILSSHPPYGSAISAEAFRVGLGLAFSEMVVDMILIGNGVYGAINNQAPEVLNMKSIGEVYKNIHDFNINLFLDGNSLDERNLSPDSLVMANVISDVELKEKINSADVVLTF